MTTLTYTQYYERIYKTKQRPPIDWELLNPADIIDIVLDDRANRSDLQLLSFLAYRDRRGGMFDWVYESPEVALKIAEGIK